MRDDSYHPQECLHDGLLVPVGDQAWAIEKDRCWMVRADHLGDLGFTLEAAKPYVTSLLRAVLDIGTLLATPLEKPDLDEPRVAKIVNTPIPDDVWSRSPYLWDGTNFGPYVLYTHRGQVAAFNPEYHRRLSYLGGEWHLSDPLEQAHIVIKGETAALLMPCKIGLAPFPLVKP